MPVGHIFVCDARCHIEHNNAALALDIVSITKATKLLLSGRIPHIEADSPIVGRECQRVDFDTKGSY